MIYTDRRQFCPHIISPACACYVSSGAVTDDLQHHSATRGVKILGQNATRFNATTAHDFLAPSDRLRNDQTFSTVASVNPQFNLRHDIYIPTSIAGIFFIPSLCRPYC